MRLHGRNAEKWWTHDHPDERYNYLYTPVELDGFADTVKAVRHVVHRLYVYLNNHFAAKAVANAALLRHGVGQENTGRYPTEMLARYPFLAPLVTPEGAASGSLFGDEGPGGKPAEDAESQEG
jgi:uncharacterized protein YecE (DUF72 family)